MDGNKSKVKEMFTSSNYKASAQQKKTHGGKIPTEKEEIFTNHLSGKTFVYEMLGTPTTYYQ